MAATAAPKRTAHALCGSELWPLKTLSDSQPKLVNLRPRATTLRAINRRRGPRVPTRRRDAFERQVWQVDAQIVESKVEADSDIHLVLFGQGGYLIAEMPAASCLPRTRRDRRAIILCAALRGATDTWRQLDAVAWVSGVGFWDFPHGQSGHARNYAELHPVTAIRLITGCGA